MAGGWTTRRDRVFSSSSYLFSFHLDNGTLERERECPFGTGVDEEEEAPFFIIRNRKEVLKKQKNDKTVTNLNSMLFGRFEI